MKEPIFEITKDLIEVGLDQVVNNEILKEIPLVGVIVNLLKLSNSVSDRIFAAKLKVLVDQLESLNSVETNEFAQKLIVDDRVAEKAGQTLILTIEKSTNLQKIQMIGLLTGSLVKGQINLEDFEDFVHVIDSFLISKIKDFIISGDYFYEGGGFMEEFYSKGLADFVSENKDFEGSIIGFNYCMNKRGKIFSSLLQPILNKKIEGLR